ncbi:MAG: exonuclease SbcCD subunit D [Aquificota bacterium]|nr:exonuclease SbcCD subunit D [Aquificota bacterium]
MRLLHIADLHAGKTLGRVSRNPDLVYALEQVVAFAKESKPDLVLIAGDVFDKANPDNESKEIIFDLFLRFREMGLDVIVISGNHDSYDFMRSIKGLSRLANVHIFDRPDKNNCVFGAGPLGVACLPYPSERVLTPAGEEAKRTYGELVGAFLRYLAEKVKGFRYRVLLAHLFVAGARFTRTEKEATITEYFAVHPSSFSETFHYIALGHVHRYQEVKGTPSRAFYTGTPYQLDFSEAGEEKGFNLIFLGESGVKVERVPLDLKNPLRVEELKQGEVMKKLEDLKGWEGYLKVVLHVEDRTTLPHVIDRLRDALSERLIRIEQVTDKQETASNGVSLQGTDPMELYREYYRNVYGTEVPEDVERAFGDLLKKAENL